MKVFVSYSHRDDSTFDKLHKHLAVLRHDGSIESWFDRKILAGGEIDAEITKQIETCELFLLLVSPNFLASYYCVEREMQRALERHATGQARVVPIIIEHCDWASSPLQKLKALPHDAKPVSEWKNENLAYLDIVKGIRRILSSNDDMNRGETDSNRLSSVKVAGQIHRYRVKRGFDEIDRSDFRKSTFKSIRNYFERAISEIDSIDGLRGRFSLLSEDSFTCTLVNQTYDQGAAYITVQCRRTIYDFDIFYAFTENTTDGAINGGFSIESDEYELFLSPMVFNYEHRDGHLTPEAVAEVLWAEFLQQVGVTYN